MLIEEVVGRQGSLSRVVSSHIRGMSRGEGEGCPVRVRVRVRVRTIFE